MLPELSTKIREMGIIELFPVVSDDGVRYFKPVYDRLSDEVSFPMLGDLGKRFSLDPFGEIINCYDEELYPSFPSGLRSNVDPRFCKRSGDNTGLSSYSDILIIGARHWHLSHFLIIQGRLVLLSIKSILGV